MSNADREQHAGAEHSTKVLVVSATAARRSQLSRAFRQASLGCGCVASLDEAVAVVCRSEVDGRGAGYEAVVVDLPACTPLALRAVRALDERRVAALLICPSVCFDEAIEAMRAGAADVVSASIKPRELTARVRSAVEAQRAAKLREARRAHDEQLSDEQQAHLAALASLGGIDESAGLDGSMDADEAADLGADGAGTTLEQIMDKPGKRNKATKVTALDATQEPSSSERAEQFAALIRGELDVESLLRQLLEFVLANVGPTNAAVFLPGSGGDFSLGAYVNYTCPKDTVEVLLDQLANVAAPRLEATTGPILLNTPAAMEERLGESAEWLRGHHLYGIACRDPKDAHAECLAVVTLFRDGRTPFDAATPDLLGRLASVFGAQLARVVRIHHRHLPKDQWGALGDPIDESDEGGMAA